jgi:phage terminase large subunit-like protein
MAEAECRVTQFAHRVLTGAVVAGPSVRAACERHFKDLAFGEDRGLYFDHEAANRVYRFFETKLRLNGGRFENKPFLLHESQAFRLGSLFGWQRHHEEFGHVRRFRRFYDEEGKGNGKSPLAAGIGMYMLMADGENRAEVYAAAAAKDQAMVLFRDAVAMRKQSPWVSERVAVRGGSVPQNMMYERRNSFFRPISPEGAHSGPRPSCALADEVHEHRNREVIDMLEAGFKFRTQPLLVMTTNSGHDKRTLCWEEHERAIKVAKGEIEDDETFAFVCDLDEGDDPLEDESCWVKVNPLLGVILEPKYLRGVVREAKNMPSKAAKIKRLHFCIWTESDKTWITDKVLRRVLHDFNPFEEHAGKEVNVGLDLGARRDLTAMAGVVETGTVEITRVDETGEEVTTTSPTYDAWVEAWTPGGTIKERELEDKAPYSLWVEQKHLFQSDGDQVSLAQVVSRVRHWDEVFKLRGLAYDRYAFDQFKEVLEQQNVEVPAFSHPQGGIKKAYIPDEEELKGRYVQVAGTDGQNVKVERDRPALWMPFSKQLLEDAIFEKRIRIRGNPVLVSAILSAAVKTDDWDNSWFIKRESTQRIDPLIALAMAVGLAYIKKLPSGRRKSYLDSGDMVWG